MMHCSTDTDAAMAADGSPLSHMPHQLPVNFELALQRCQSADSLASDGARASVGGEEEDEFRFVETSHPHRMMVCLNLLRQSRALSDVVLCVEGREFPAHRVVLAAFSSYFRAMFCGEMAESRQDRVRLNGVGADMVGLLLDFAYTGELIITQDNVQRLLGAASLLAVTAVQDACARFMAGHLDDGNALGVHCFAEAHHCTNLATTAREYVLENFQGVSQLEELLQLSADKLVEIISDDDLIADSENVVFEAVTRWLDHNREAREPIFERVLAAVRLPLMSPYYLHDVVLTHSTVHSQPSCRTLVEEALAFQLLVNRRSELASPRSRPRKSSGVVEVVVVVGGEDDKVVFRSVETFDPQGNLWRPLACLSFAVSKHGLVAHGNQWLYLAGGETPCGIAGNSVWRYDFSSDLWQEMAPMNTPRTELGLAVVDTHIYAVGGWNGATRLSSLERYDPEINQWLPVPNMKTALTSPAVAALHGKLYVTGGAMLEDGDGVDLVQCYDTVTQTWADKAPMTIPRSGSAACALNGYIYVLGGWHASTENTNKVERYDPASNTWTACSPMLERRYRPGVAVVAGKIYVCGGEEGWDRYHDTVECYSPDKDSWEIIAEMPMSRSCLSCVAVTVPKRLLLSRMGLRSQGPFLEPL